MDDTETKVAFKYPKSFLKTQYSEILVEYEEVFDKKTGKLSIDPAHPNQTRKDENSYTPVTFYKSTGNAGGKIRPEDKVNTRLQELSHMKNTNFGAIHYDINLDKEQPLH